MASPTAGGADKKQPLRCRCIAHDGDKYQAVTTVKNMGDVPGWSCEGVLIPKAETVPIGRKRDKSKPALSGGGVSWQRIYLNRIMPTKAAGCCRIDSAVSL